MIAHKLMCRMLFVIVSLLRVYVCVGGFSPLFLLVVFSLSITCPGYQGKLDTYSKPHLIVISEGSGDASQIVLPV